jgi:hypothetical protein
MGLKNTKPGPGVSLQTPIGCFVSNDLQVVSHSGPQEVRVRLLAP